MDRESQITALQDADFDLLVIGGGATGAGIALDAVSRGLKVALVEKGDFASGTSSRSTKLIHGGVRYLERAFWDLDRAQYGLVKEALHERSILLKIAPHLARHVPLLTPLYRRVEVPYYLAGLKMYDWLANDEQTPPSRYINAEDALKHCPMLREKGLRGGVVYYDGQFDDARMNISILLRAMDLGARAVNYVEVASFTKTAGKITGAQLKDALTDKHFSVQARAVINATGPLADSVRHMDDPKLKPMLKASSGSHIVLDRRFSPAEMGLLIPKTEDDRVLFLLPWMGHTLVGTTDNPAPVQNNPLASAEDIRYILRQLAKYFSIAVSEKDVLAKWCGLRPLVQPGAAVSTAKISREHTIEALPSGLITIAGGKWTTYRRMALEAVDEAVALHKLPVKRASQTETLAVAGGGDYKPDQPQRLEKRFQLPLTVCKHLSLSYGDRAERVCELALKTDKRVLVPGAPYLEAEVAYAALHESARSTVDVLARRMRLAFVNKEGADYARTRVQELLGDALGWDQAQRDADSRRYDAYFG
ncbi:FAD-dependent oxidoreductase [bacterium]|nr:FAD-dependent oxidoreductase [bacterium]